MQRAPERTAVRLPNMPCKQITELGCIAVRHIISAAELLSLFCLYMAIAQLLIEYIRYQHRKIRLTLSVMTLLVACVWQATAASSKQYARARGAATCQRQRRQEQRWSPCQSAFTQMGETAPSVCLEGGCRHQVGMSTGPSCTCWTP